MKKFLVMLVSLFVISGCTNVMNTPTKKVENFLNKYQKQDTNVLTQLDNVIASDVTMNDGQKKDYKELMKKQYQGLTYKIKDETVDGDKATIEVEIEVYDFRKAIEEANAYLVSNNDEFLDDNGNVDDTKFMDYKIDKMKNAKDKVTYTLNLTLSKVNDEWKLNDITETDRQKIHGLYNY